MCFVEATHQCLDWLCLGFGKEKSTNLIILHNNTWDQRPLDTTTKIAKTWTHVTHLDRVLLVTLSAWAEFRLGFHSPFKSKPVSAIYSAYRNPTQHIHVFKLGGVATTAAEKT